MTEPMNAQSRVLEQTLRLSQIPRHVPVHLNTYQSLRPKLPPRYEVTCSCGWTSRDTGNWIQSIQDHRYREYKKEVGE